MINILILEDEVPAANGLARMIKSIEPSAQFCGTISSVTGGLEWFRDNPCPDLILSDIQLADGKSFEIFKQVRPCCPIIFITAYDQYAINAFKLNSIGYLLKPLKKNELAAAISKFNTLRSLGKLNSFDFQKFLKDYKSPIPCYKNRFIVKYGQCIKIIRTEQIAYFKTDNKQTFLITHEAKGFITDYNLEELETLLDPGQFFRINRQYLISIDSISEMLSYSKSRVSIKLKTPTDHETIVSTQRSADFKAWLDDSL